MTFEPTTISSMFDAVIVQKSPAAPLYSEHSFDRWSSPLRGMEPPFGWSSLWDFEGI